MRALYKATAEDQVAQGKLQIFLDGLRASAVAMFENGVWKIDAKKLLW